MRYHNLLPLVAMDDFLKTTILIFAMLFFGSYNTINTKIQDQTCAPTLELSAVDHPMNNCPSGQKLWAKPWLQNLLMFVGEASMLAIYGAKRLRVQLAGSPAAVGRDGANGLLADAPKKTPFYIFAVPAFCDVFGTGLGSVSLLFLDSAIWQMLRSSIIIFSAIVSVFFLKRRLQPFHWAATGVVFVGLVLVGIASGLDAGSDTTGPKVSTYETLVGIALVVSAQACSAFQMCFEELLLTGRAKTSAKKVVGMEGVWGIVFMVVILALMSNMPGEDVGHYESFSDGVHMLTGSPNLLFFVVTYMISIAVYNFVGITVGKKMSAVVRCLVDSCRTVVVWVMNLVLYYCVSEQYGTAWKPHTWLQVIGFAFLVLGTLLYNEVVPSPKFLTRPVALTGREDEYGIASVVSGFNDILAKVDLTDENEDAASARTTALGGSAHGQGVSLRSDFRSDA